jgi:hypothetical protein
LAAIRCASSRVNRPMAMRGPGTALGSRFFLTSAANPPRNKSATLQHHHNGDGHEYSKSNNHDADWIIRGHF